MCIMNQKSSSGTGFQNIDTSPGINPYGGRFADTASDPLSIKGKGYFGALPHAGGGVSTEISASNDITSYPLLVPTLSNKEKKSLLDGNEPTDAIYRKAESWAKMRIDQGRSPFASPTELRIPKDYEF